MGQQDGTIIRAQLRDSFFFITRPACVQTNRPGLRGQTPPGCRTHMRYLVTKRETDSTPQTCSMDRTYRDVSASG
jgi:hypothetical protein